MLSIVEKHGVLPSNLSGTGSDTMASCSLALLLNEASKMIVASDLGHEEWQ